MSAGDTMLEGQYYDGRAPTGSKATLIFHDQDVAVIGERLSESYGMRALRVSPRVGRAHRFIMLPNGGQLLCPDHPLLDRLPQTTRSEGPVAWLEQRVGVAIASVVVIAGILLGGYFYGLPAAAKRIAGRIPIETEQALGDQMLAWLDEREWFKPTQLTPALQDVVRKRFQRLSKGLPLAPHYRLEFRSAPVIGANAFALPGGTLVMLDEMVTASESVDEVLAVLAHEIGHIELRHTMRQILQGSATAVVATAVTGDASSLSIAVAGLPTLLVQAKYSREFETEADEYAFALLKRRGLSPESFANLMERLSKDTEGAERSLAFLSTHPVTAERVQRARAAAGQ